MNQHEQDSAEGFAELLDAAGVVLNLGGTPLKTLLRTTPPEANRYDLSVGDDNSVQVRVLAAAFSGGLPIAGSSFADEAGTTYRIRSIARSPSRALITFDCELCQP
jgi:hypothetical protein